MRYGSPTSWLNHNEDDLDIDSMGETESTADSFVNPSGIRIEFRSEFLAEAVDRIEECADLEDTDSKNTWQWNGSDMNVSWDACEPKTVSYSFDGSPQVVTLSILCKFVVLSVECGPAVGIKTGAAVSWF